MQINIRGLGPVLLPEDLPLELRELDVHAIELHLLVLGAVGKLVVHS